MQSQSSESLGITALNIKQIRLFTVIGMGLILAFMLSDIRLLPESLHNAYFTSRLKMKIPICALFLAATYLPHFSRYYQIMLTITMVLLTYANFWLIAHCWQSEQVTFPYEGTIVYSLFTFFIFRISFTYGIIFSLIVLLGFSGLISIYPAYGIYGLNNLGFVFVALLAGLIGVFRIESGIKQLTEVNNTLTVLSETDPLTKIFNRRTYEARFAKQFKLCQRAETTLAVFIIDLDFFKAYNDNYGHVRGDEVIYKQAKYLQQIFRRETDIVARYGGEEFVVVTSNVTQEQCIAFASQIVEKWHQKKIPHGKGGANTYISCSVGFCAQQVESDNNKEILVKRADNALYQAKTQGRNRYEQYQSDKTDLAQQTAQEAEPKDKSNPALVSTPKAGA